MARRDCRCFTAPSGQGSDAADDVSDGDGTGAGGSVVAVPGCACPTPGAGDAVALVPPLLLAP